MRFLSFVAVGCLALALPGCGLDANGLGTEDGSAPLVEAGAPPRDGTVTNEDGSVPPAETGPGTDDGGEDSTSGGDATEDDAGDSGEDTGTDAADGGTDAADSGPADGGDAGADSGIPDAGDDAGPPCTGTCTIAAVPNGWSIVEYAEATQPACSTGYGSSSDVVEGPAGTPATCGCSCNVTTAGTCMDGDFTVSVDGIGGGTCSTLFSVTSPVDGGGCTAASADYSPSGNPMMKVDTAPYASGGCTPVPSVVTTPVTFNAQGRICTSNSSPTGSCPNGGSCAATPAGFSLCIKHDGTQTCPSGFPLPPHIVGTTSNVTDTRGCTACSCGAADAGCAGTLTLYTNAGCTTGAESVPANDTCNAFPGPNGIGGPKYVAYEYAAQAQGEGCPPSAVVSDGGVAFSTTHTICCQ